MGEPERKLVLQSLLLVPSHFYSPRTMHYSRGYQFSAHMDSPDGSTKEDAASETKQKERVNETERQQLHNTNAGDSRWLISTG